MLPIGYLIFDNIVSQPDCDTLTAHVAKIPLNGAGARTLLLNDWCQDLARSLRANTTLAPFIPQNFVAVQCTLFDKSPDMNWALNMHQDNAIPVREKVPDPDCTGWSEKDGFTFCIAPPELLVKLIAVRVHLDACPSGNGHLRVIPGSHLLGRLDGDGIKSARERFGEVECPVTRGGAMLMKPLLLHGSSKAVKPSSRRVLHFLFGPAELRHGLKWALTI